MLDVRGAAFQIYPWWIGERVADRPFERSNLIHRSRIERQLRKERIAAGTDSVDRIIDALFAIDRQMASLSLPQEYARASYGALAYSVNVGPAVAHAFVNVVADLRKTGPMHVDDARLLIHSRAMGLQDQTAIGLAYLLVKEGRLAVEILGGSRHWIVAE